MKSISRLFAATIIFIFCNMARAEYHQILHVSDFDAGWFSTNKTWLYVNDDGLWLEIQETSGVVIKTNSTQKLKGCKDPKDGRMWFPINENSSYVISQHLGYSPDEKRPDLQLGTVTIYAYKKTSNQEQAERIGSWGRSFLFIADKIKATQALDRLVQTEPTKFNCRSSELTEAQENPM